MEYLQGTLVVDRRGDIRMCSGPLARRVGRRPHELAGEPVWTLLPGWTPFGEAGAETRLRLLSGHGGAAVRVSWEAVHLPGDTLFVMEVRGTGDAQAPPGLAAAAELSPEAMMITDRRGVIQYVNAAFEAMTGYTQIELAGRTPAVLKSGVQDAGFYRDLWNTILGGGVYRGVLVNRRKGGGLYQEEKIIRPVADAGSGATHFVSSGRDISERVRELQALRRAATHDGLTGLANHGLFLDRLEQALRRAARRDETFTLALADIDRFKEINDRLGHSAGDGVLRSLAARLRHGVREADTVARIGGDEFGLILAGAGTRAAAARVLEKVLASASATVTLSVGACLFPGDGSGSEILLRHADSAMYRAKRSGGNAFRFHRQVLAAVPQRACADA